MHLPLCTTFYISLRNLDLYLQVLKARLQGLFISKIGKWISLNENQRQLVSGMTTLRWIKAISKFYFSCDPRVDPC